MAASKTEINTLEVRVSASALQASAALDILADKLESVGKIIDRVTTSAKGLASIGRVDTGNLRDVLTSAKELARSLKDVDKKKPDIVVRTENIEKANRKLDELFEKASGKSSYFNDTTNQSDMRLNLDLWTRGLEDARKRFDELVEAGDNKKGIGSKAFDSAIEQIVEYQNAIGMAEDALADWDNYVKGLQASSGDMIPGRDDIQNAEAYEGVAEAVEEMAEAEEDAYEAGNRLRGALDGLARAAGGLLRAAWGLVRVNTHIYLRVLSTTAHAAVNAFKKMPSALKNAASAAARFGKALAHPVAVLKQLLGLDKRKSNGILGGLLGNRSLGKYVGLIALRRAVTAAIRAIVSGIKEGFEHIRQYSSAINSEMNTIQNSLLYVKNAWAAAFAPIISVVRPYINALLDMLASALNAIGRLVAILTGKGFAVQAVKLSDALYEAGEAGEKAAGGTGKATKAAEEYKKTIMGFDQLNVLNAPNESGGSGGSGGGGGGSNSGLNVEDMFEEVDLAGRLKDAVDAGNWEEVGRYFAEKINDFFTRVDEAVKWENVGEKITGAITALTTTVNSLIDNVDWDLVGRTVGDGIDTIVKSYNLLFDGLDFESMGTSASEAVNGFVNEIKWSEVGEALVQKFNAIWETGGSFISGLDFAKIGASLGYALTGAAEKIDLATVGTAISNAINGVTIMISNANMAFTSDILTGNSSITGKIEEFITNAIGGIDTQRIQSTMDGLAQTIGSILGSAIDAFFKAGGTTKLASLLGSGIEAAGVLLKNLDSSVDWDTVKSDITTAITTLLGKITKSDFMGHALTLVINIAGAIADAVLNEDVAASFSSFATNLLTSINTAIKKVDWEDVGNKVGTFLKKIEWGDIFSAFCEGVGAVFAGLGSFLIGLVTGAFGEWVDSIKERMEGFGEDTMGGFFAGIGVALYDVATWIWNNIFTPFWNGIKSAFGIASPSTKMAEIGGYVIEGFYNGITSAWSTVTEWFSTAWENIKSFFNDPIGTIKIGIDKASEKAAEIWNGIEDSTVVKTLTTTGEKAVEYVKDKIWDPIATSDAVKTIKGTVTDAFTKAKDVWKEVTSSEETKDLVARTKPGTPSISNTLTKVWNKFTSSEPVKNLVAQTKAGKQKVSDVLTKVWNKFTTSDATKNLYADQKKSFSDNKETYDNWKDKDVTVTAQANKFQNNLGTPTINVKANITEVNGDKWGIWSRNGATGGIYAGGRWKSITSYASGGIVGQTGEMFVAREAGPELVGRIGSKTAIMNNNQIVASVAEGVKSAVAEVMMAYASASNSTPVVVNTTIKTQNDEVLARAVERGMAKRSYRFGS